jgi:hypothetical protein
MSGRTGFLATPKKTIPGQPISGWRPVWIHSGTVFFLDTRMNQTFLKYLESVRL